jgi:hypothetical protein
MTPLEALLLLLERIEASRGAAALVNEEELSGWPMAAVKAMKSHKLLHKASPATSVTCSGCEQQCAMLVETLPGGTRPAVSFVVCDKRDDINRVPVPIERLRQWQISGQSIADYLARILKLSRSDFGEAATGRWEVGVLRGKKRSSHVVLVAEDKLVLKLTGHSVELAEILTLDDSGLKLDKQSLIRLVDDPIASAGDAESAEKRAARLKKEVEAEKDKGNRAFLKTVASNEGISISRLKQILYRKPSLKKTTSARIPY